MKITETALVEGFDGKTKGGSNISLVKGQQVYWDYREGRDEDGYDCVCSPDAGRHITLEYDRQGDIELDSPRPDYQAITRAEAELWGTEVRAEAGG